MAWPPGPYSTRLPSPCMISWYWPFGEERDWLAVRTRAAGPLAVVAACAPPWAPDPAGAGWSPGGAGGAGGVPPPPTSGRPGGRGHARAGTEEGDRPLEA